MSNGEEKGMHVPHEDSFSFLLDRLVQEIDIINSAIRNADQIAQGMKNWTILVWTGSVALMGARPELRHLLWLTGLPPLLFYFVDAWWRHLQKRSIERLRRMSEFMNGPDFRAAFERRDLSGLRVMDPVGRQDWGQAEFETATGILRTLKYPDLWVFYGGLASISVVFWLLCRSAA